MRGRVPSERIQKTSFRAPASCMHALECRLTVPTSCLASPTWPCADQLLRQAVPGGAHVPAPAQPLHRHHRQLLKDAVRQSLPANEPCTRCMTCPWHAFTPTTTTTTTTTTPLSLSLSLSLSLPLSLSLVALSHVAITVPFHNRLGVCQPFLRQPRVATFHPPPPLLGPRHLSLRQVL